MTKTNISGWKRERKVLRRIPKQDRALDRVMSILSVAEKLIGEHGIDAVTMKEIGRQSGGPISSVYQYFPDKSAILAMLHDRHVNLTRRLVVEVVATIKSREDALKAPGKLFDAYYRAMRENAAAVQILTAIKASKSLAEQDIEETRYQVQDFYEATEQFVAKSRGADFKAALFLMFNMADATLRLALTSPPQESDTYIAHVKVIVQTQLTFFLDGEWPKWPAAITARA
ncbi:TetR/AcrR family transcriptional regulator [Endobacterium cereale]|uniref:TetR/AcrR family transcriptional regulator n=1 Tax=Endobacterium cereale TaxID=2663029 RepID=UPI002B45CC1F|nr:TetR/AcrR family transcriptional regulator [Endobacterium cereale]MEB2846488.1 TetR/AcrR family transcriptional regulator [Endobacterium cereale]